MKHIDKNITLRSQSSLQKTTVPPAGNPNNTMTSSLAEANPPPGWVLLPLRLFLGITFVYAGVQKVTDPQFFRPSMPGYIGNQIIAFAHGSPLHDVLLRMVQPHAVLFGLLIALGEIAIGTGTLVGLLFRPSAFFGVVLRVLFFL